ncbi:MAG: RdgB/HAM1 family non-canonical purine NTP pyrophosphatase [Rhodothermales bacterium]
MPLKLVLATRNAGKVAEMRALLDGLPVDVISADAFPAMPDVEEDEPTLRGNAGKKAREVYEYTKLPALSDDTGLEVDALDGRPGVYSARYAGPEANPAANRRLLLEELGEAPDRTASFRTVLAFYDGHAMHFFDGVCPGRILEEERGAGGFGYDALFLPDGETLTFAELPPARKNAISHRGRAMRAFRTFLETRLSEGGV